MERVSYDQGDYAALVLRLTLGGMYLSHGLIKLLVFTLPGTVAYFQSVGFPGFFAYVVTFAEIGSGILLITGLSTRWVALAMIPILLGALQVHSGNGFFFSVKGGGWEYPVFLILASLTQALLGNGAYSAHGVFRKCTSIDLPR